jgi:hypothetical protein
MNSEQDWKHTNTQVFWGEIAPCDHVVQVYENDEVFLSSLESFTADGLLTGDAVILIATPAHLHALMHRLEDHNFPVAAMRAADQFIPLDAEQTLAQFMVNGWPDEKKFIDLVTALIRRAGVGNRRVRAFGEMVALLWAQGHSGATVHLEHLWNLFCAREVFCLFCAYPKSGFTDDAQTSMAHICSAHSKIVAGWQTTPGEIYYQRNGAGITTA